MSSKEEFKAKLQKLVELFEYNYEFYKSKDYKEDHLRQEFINPFFKALGWDMDNTQEFAPQYREVIHEDKIEIEGKPKAPDYSFRIGGVRKFFVEAKAASVKIISEFPPSFQLRRYAWSGKLPVSILTDFEEFSIYDTTIEPKAVDKTETARIKYIYFRDYLKEADYIWDTFSKEGILKGAFDKFAKAEKKGQQVVDKIFLKEIEEWRNWLAKDIAINNTNIDIYKLNEAVQKIIDRIIFLRIAEDRGIEFYETLKKTIDSKDTYGQLVKIFRKAHDKYNSNLFDFKNDFTSDLKISDKVFDRIISSLYYPKSPYEFSVIGVEILGSVYEQFLGKVIRLTKGHNAIIEEKPEVKKAGGVYYTPQYIVEYIVKNTVGELVKDKTPKEVSKLKIVDPACGSGSFLIGAYTFLLDWHLKYYTDSTSDNFIKSKAIFKDHEGNYKLSTSEKKRILINNIYGVDLDSQAVEVSKLSLALKMLEDENSETINTQIKMFQDRILPDLGTNIKCGNSLIGTDYYVDKNLSLLGDEEIRKVNAFDWEKEFVEVFKQGGFDAVIGNPPYVDNRGFDKDQLKYFSKVYVGLGKSGTDKFKTTKFNTFTLFIEKIKHLLRKNGKAGYIVHKNLLKTTAYSNIRKFILDNLNIYKITDWGADQFDNVVAETITLFLEAIKAHGKTIIETYKKDISISEAKIDQRTFLSNYDYIFLINLSDSDLQLLDKIENRKSGPLENYININNGLVTGNDKVFISKSKLSNNYYPCLTGKNIKRYYIAGTKGYVNYDTSNLLRPRNRVIFTSEKLIMQMISSKLILAYDNKAFFNLGTTYSLTSKSEVNSPLKYFLGVLNSKLMNYYYQKRFTNLSSLTNAVSTKNLMRLPIVYSSTNKQINIIVETVDNLLTTYQELYSSIITQSQKKLLEQRAEKLDRQIDELVYELYGLTEEEIDVIEKAND